MIKAQRSELAIKWVQWSDCSNHVVLSNKCNRAFKATENVLEHRLKKVQYEANKNEDSLALAKNREAARKIKTG